MRGWRHIVSCFALCGALGLSAPASALAISAGDQQYVDPLAGTTTSTATPPPSTTHASPPSPAARPSVSSASSAASSPSATTAAATPTSAPQATSTTLPYTGLNVWVCAAVGFTLGGAGWALRRLARSD